MSDQARTPHEPRFTLSDLATLHAESTQGEWLTDAWVASAEDFGIRISATDSAFIAAAHDLVPELLAAFAALAERNTALERERRAAEKERDAAWKLEHLATAKFVAAESRVELMREALERIQARLVDESWMSSADAEDLFVRAAAVAPPEPGERPSVCYLECVPGTSDCACAIAINTKEMGIATPRSSTPREQEPEGSKEQRACMRCGSTVYTEVNEVSYSGCSDCYEPDEDDAAPPEPAPEEPLTLGDFVDPEAESVDAAPPVLGEPHDNGESPVDDPECGTDIGPFPAPPVPGEPLLNA